MAFSSGDGFPCIVAEVGSYATKMGFAGEDYPRSFFRSTTAILREETNPPSAAIQKRSYDFFSRPLNPSENHDDGWEICNPIDETTGLVYDSAASGSRSTTTNTTTATAATCNESSMSSSSPLPNNDMCSYHPPLGECYTHFSNHIVHGYQSALCTESHTAPLMLVEKAYNPPPIRQKLMEILMEEHSVPATFFVRDAVCACYAVGRTTGTVIDMGHSGTVVTPVYDGFVETRGIRRSPVGGRIMGKMVLSHLDGLYRMKKTRLKYKSPVDYVMPLYQVRAEGNVARKEPFHGLARMDMARLCMESGAGAGVAGFGYVALHDLEDGEGGDGYHPQQQPSLQMESTNEMYQQYANAPKAPYKLPDGTIVDISQTKRFDVSELLFGKAGRSARIRKEAMEEAKKRLDGMIAEASEMNGTMESSQEGSTGQTNKGGVGITSEMDAILQIEEMAKRKKTAWGHAGDGDNSKKKVSLLASHQSLMRACAPYLQTSIGEFTASTLPSMICESAFCVIESSNLNSWEMRYCVEVGHVLQLRCCRVPMRL
jgi:Actin and related proteins